VVYRVDARSRALLGRPVDVGADVGWLVTGAGAVWVRSSQKRALLKLVPTSPVPAPQRVAPARGSPPPAAAGPLRPGTWATHDFGVPFTFTIAEPGWVLAADHPEAVQLAPADDPPAAVTAYLPRQAFTPSGRLQRLRTSRQAVALVTANPHLQVSGRRRTSLGGVPATQLDVRVRPYRGYPGFCQSPCVVLYAFPASSAGLGAAAPARMWFLSHRGRVVVVIAEIDRRKPNSAGTEALVQTLRFR
jgi:hypothetical protein